MALSFLYLMARRLIGMLLGSLQSERAKNVEIGVLRHQLDVLRCQVQRPEFPPADRALLAMLSGALLAGRASWLSRTRSCGGTAAWSPANGRRLNIEAGARRLPSTWSR
jgi:hypothetical protein